VFATASAGRIDIPFAARVEVSPDGSSREAAVDLAVLLGLLDGKADAWTCRCVQPLPTPGGPPSWALRIRENTPAAIVHPPGEVEVGRAFRALEDLLAPAEKLGLVTVVRVYDGDRPALRIAPGGCVGFAAGEHAGVRLHVRVDPKIDGVAWMRLLAESGRLDIKGWVADVDPGIDSLDELLVVAYRRALDRFFGLEEGNTARRRGTGLRRLHCDQNEDLRCRVRGRVVLPGYLRELARGRPLILPCHYAVHELDNLPNRILRWALHLAERIAISRLEPCVPGDNRELSPSRGGATRERPALWPHRDALRQRTALFSGVPLVPLRAGDGRPERLRHLPQSFAHYVNSGALPLALLLLRHVSLGPELGERRSFGLSFDLARVFQDAFVAGVKRHFPHAKGQHEFRLTVQGAAKPVRFVPDLWIPPHPASRTPLVLDTKWKALLPDSTAADDDIDRPLADGRVLRIRSADVAQILSYAFLLRGTIAESMAPTAPLVGALVYPATSREASFEMRLPGPRSDLRIVVVPWCVRAGDFQPAQEVLGELLTAVTPGGSASSPRSERATQALPR
jgi:hypothetical protein